MKKNVMTFALLALPVFLLSACSNGELQNQVQALTEEKSGLQARVQTLTEEKAALQELLDKQPGLKIDYLDTTASVDRTGGQVNWRNYEARNSFIAGSTDGLWVMFGFSNMLHSGSVNVKADIYIISNGKIVAWRNNDASLNNSTYWELYWGDTFDISNYPAGDYTALVTIHDFIAGTSATRKAVFKIEPLINGDGGTGK
ncbi:MAG: hypothetical protein C4555_01405 [Dehalococcoidia bacterium]|nr:MAG: hypothetical protein C4555_01405 [Dehalococcoidia bacterium]